MRSIVLLSMVLVFASAASGRADGIRLNCHRTSADHPDRPDPIEENFEIDTAGETVTKIDGCARRIYTNSADTHLNGYHSKCPLSSDPLIRSLQTGVSNSEDDAKYYVRISPQLIEWGQDGRRSAASSEFDRTTNILSIRSICKSCIRIVSYLKTYRCKTASHK